MLRAMFRAVVIVALGAALAACSGKTASPSGLRADLDKICNAVELSGAAALEPADRAYTMAGWLGTHITSAEGRKFLQDFARLGDDKAARRKLLEGTAAKVGLAGCPLAAEWR